MSAADKIVQALHDILDPIAYIERGLQEGERLNGQAALQQINSREFYLRIARKALAEFEAEKAQPAQAPAPVDGTAPTEPITEAEAIKLWHAAKDAHRRSSAFEWFSAGLIAAQGRYGILKGQE